MFSCDVHILCFRHLWVRLLQGNVLIFKPDCVLCVNGTLQKIMFLVSFSWTYLKTSSKISLFEKQTVWLSSPFFKNKNHMTEKVRLIQDKWWGFNLSEDMFLSDFTKMILHVPVSFSEGCIIMPVSFDKQMSFCELWGSSESFTVLNWIFKNHSVVHNQNKSLLKCECLQIGERNSRFLCLTDSFKNWFVQNLAQFCFSANLILF